MMYPALCTDGFHCELDVVTSQVVSGFLSQVVAVGYKDYSLQRCGKLLSLAVPQWEETQGGSVHLHEGGAH